MSAETIDLVILAVIQEQDVDAATRAMEPLGTHVTQLASSGAFLGRHNATLLIPLPHAKMDQALEILRSTCRQRVEYMTMPVEGAPMPMPAPIPVTVGGATVFALPVERFEQIF